MLHHQSLDQHSHMAVEVAAVEVAQVVAAQQVAVQVEQAAAVLVQATTEHHLSRQQVEVLTLVVAVAVALELAAQQEAMEQRAALELSSFGMCLRHQIIQFQ